MRMRKLHKRDWMRCWERPEKKLFFARPGYYMGSGGAETMITGISLVSVVRDENRDQTRALSGCNSRFLFHRATAYCTM
ncbi:hypothetical protein SAMN05216316_2343 [Nitrosovibrio sp. Nv6]|nr:hypothetical protein SAMN05216316_2343 [Nitrosovibrio sp. Nv6]